MRNVTMVVPVLMISCQVSDHPNTGPVQAHPRTRKVAIRKACHDPAADDTSLVKAEKRLPMATSMSGEGTMGDKPRRMTYLTVGGETRPVEEWARITGIRDDLIRSRIRRGWAPEEVIGRRDRKRPGRKAGAVRVTRLEVDGESHTVAEWAAMTGISAGLIRSRLRRGLLPGVAIQGGRLPGTGKSVKRVLDADKVTAIRKDTRSYKAIAEQYGISLATVGHIKKRQTWKHVDDDDPEGTGLPEHTNLKAAPTQLVADGASHTIAE